MCASSPKSSPGTAAVGLQIHSLMAELFPICRSRTGNGIRQTLEILRRHVPLKVHEVATGIYLVRLENGAAAATGRIVKLR
mgnify:CR=1 FL=1